MKDITRKLHKGNDGAVARYVIIHGPPDEEIGLRVYDVVGGDALVFLTDARARKLIADIERTLAARNRGRR